MQLHQERLVKIRDLFSINWLSNILAWTRDFGTDSGILARLRAPAKSSSTGDDVVAEVFRTLRFSYIAAALISVLINVLMLTGPIYMLQVYDRVLASSSVPTLVVISIFAISLYSFYGFLEILRGRILSRLGLIVDAKLSPLAYSHSTSLPIIDANSIAKLRPINDLDSVRQFLSGPGPGGIFDLPWMPMYLGIIFLFHPIMGGLATGGAIVICILIAINEMVSRKPVAKASIQAGQRSNVVQNSQQNAEAVYAMGMDVSLVDRWETLNKKFLKTQEGSGDASSGIGTVIKTARLILQSSILGVGAYLAILQEITPGVMIASSIMMSRGMAPVEVAVGQWRSFVSCRQAVRRLRKLLRSVPQSNNEFELPTPKESLILSGVSCCPLGSQIPFIKDVSFTLSAGDALGIIGPSGCGKTTLARALVGIVPAVAGSIQYDAAELAQWPVNKRGDFIGYLPQNIQLFDGTIAENIARMRQDIDSERVIEAAQLADVHELIVNLPEGYDTLIGRGGRALSAGQIQRIALARALYGSPFLVVLDEPNSNLDSEGENALSNAITVLREKGSIVIIIAHRPSSLSKVNLVLCLNNGLTVEVGPRDEVLNKVLAPVAKVIEGEAG